MSETYVDLSYSQSTNIDFVAMRAAGVTGAIFKAGGSNTGSRYVDSKYNYFVPRARAAGMRIGHYWFNGELDPAGDADYFLNNLNGYTPSDILALDVEGEAGTANVPWNPDRADAFNARVQSVKGVVPWTYMSTSVTKAFNWSKVVNRGSKLWVADYTGGTPHPSYWDSYAAHQYTSSGSFPGYSGRLDVSNVYDTSGSTPIIQTEEPVMRIFSGPYYRAAGYNVKVTEYTAESIDTNVAGVLRKYFPSQDLDSDDDLNTIIAQTWGNNATFVSKIQPAVGGATGDGVTLDQIKTVISDALGVGGPVLTTDALVEAVKVAIKATPLSVDGTAIGNATADVLAARMNS